MSPKKLKSLSFSLSLSYFFLSLFSRVKGDKKESGDLFLLDESNEARIKSSMRLFYVVFVVLCKYDRLLKKLS